MVNSKAFFDFIEEKILLVYFKINLFSRHKWKRNCPTYTVRSNPRCLYIICRVLLTPIAYLVIYN